MPNWCMTQVTFNGNPVNIKTLYDYINNQAANESVGIENDFGPTWLGNYLERAGISHFDYKCRGSVVYIGKLTDDGESFSIEVETAWCPMVKMWQAIIDKLNLGEIEIIYSATELGAGLYCTNDPALIGRYYIDMYDPDVLDASIVEALSWDDYDNVSEQDLRDSLLKLFPSRENINTDELLSMLDELTNNDGISIYEWENVPIEESE